VGGGEDLHFDLVIAGEALAELIDYVVTAAIDEGNTARGQEARDVLGHANHIFGADRYLKIFLDQYSIAVFGLAHRSYFFPIVASDVGREPFAANERPEVAAPKFGLDRVESFAVHIQFDSGAV